MSRGSKVIITVVVAILAVSVTGFAVYTAVRNGSSEPVTITSETAPGDIPATSSTAPSDEYDLSREILGKWVDSANMSGYEFFDDGTVNVTYVNMTIPVVNIPISGDAKGTYSVNGNDLEVHFSIYSGNIDIFYHASIKDNTLTLVTVDKEDTSTYIRASSGQSPAQTTVPAPSTLPEEETLTGSWKSSDNLVEYFFFENGTLEVKLFKAEGTAVYNGVYIDDNGTLTIQYNAEGKTVTESFSYKLNGLSMSLTSPEGETVLFTKTSGDEKKLLGKWQDSSKMSGFEFKENGVVEVTYINLTIPVVNIPINGSFTGSYSVDGNSITISYSVYSNAISETYYYSVSGSTLTLTNVSDGDVSTYIKA